MRWPSLLLAGAVLAVMAVVAGRSLAHVERASYWPDPAADRSLSPPTGGAVPEYRSLFTALDKAPPGDTRVVCQGAVPSRNASRRARKRLLAARRAGASGSQVRKLKRNVRIAKRLYRRGVRRNTSMGRLRRQINAARARGYTIRPTDERSLSRSQARRLYRFNLRLLAQCKYHEIQPAVTASGNNDRVVIMPGIYTEPTARAQPVNDPDCKDLVILNDRGQPNGVSYAYHLKCPNDQNLVAVLGHELGPGKDPEEPLWDRHGIPNLGPCIRCNLQLEGSGVGPDDVVVDAGRVESGNRGPIGAVKDVAIRSDRADGFVLANLTARHAHEHNIYVLESEGTRLQEFKTFYPGEYGVLTFVADHSLIQDCEAAGAGDAGLYPGSSADVGEETVEPQQRFSTELRRCDMHHNVAGYSGTAANAVHVHQNNFYDNALGFTTDVFTAAGHPGFPQDSDLVENNNFYSNNFNPYVESSDVEPTIPVPVGTGFWIAGGNNNSFRNNRFWDNWRRGSMVFSVPDAFVCGDNPVAGGNKQKGCDETQVSTSHRNKIFENTMGRRPDGTVDPNGLDFWWDNFGGNRNNCWYGNTGRDGTESSVTTDPALLPSDCDSSVGTGGTGPTEELNCFADFDEDTPDLAECPWFTTPREPE